MFERITANILFV